MGTLLLYGSVLRCLEEGAEATQEPGWRLVIVLSFIHHVALRHDTTCHVCMYCIWGATTQKFHGSVGYFSVTVRYFFQYKKDKFPCP